MDFILLTICVLTILMSVLFFLESVGLLKTTLVEMEPGNRMLRPISIGQNDYRWFVRIDLWFYGIRITRT